MRLARSRPARHTRTLPSRSGGVRGESAAGGSGRVPIRSAPIPGTGAPPDADTGADPSPPPQGLQRQLSDTASATSSSSPSGGRHASRRSPGPGRASRFIYLPAAPAPRLGRRCIGQGCAERQLACQVLPRLVAGAGAPGQSRSARHSFGRNAKRAPLVHAAPLRPTRAVSRGATPRTAKFCESSGNPQACTRLMQSFMS